MNPRVSSVEVRTRNPILQSLALALLGVALVAALIMGAVVFAVLLGIFAVGYLVSLVYAWWRLRRIRRRVASVDAAFSVEARGAEGKSGYIEGEFEVVEVTAEAARRGSGRPA